MRRSALFLIPLVLLGAAACVPLPPEAQSPDPDPSVPPPVTAPSATSPNENPAIEAWLTAIDEHEQVQGVEVEYPEDDSSYLSVDIFVNDDIDRAHLQEVYTLALDEADAQGVAHVLDDCICNIELQESGDRVVEFDSTSYPQIDAVFDAWEWAANFGGDTAPSLNLWLSDPGVYAWVGSDDLLTAVNDVSEGGVATAFLDSGVGVTLFEEVEYGSCSILGFTAAMPAAEQTVMTSILTTGLNGETDFCLEGTRDQDGWILRDVIDPEDYAANPELLLAWGNALIATGVEVTYS